MIRPACSPGLTMLTASREVWDMSYKWAEVLRCSYPGEPAGQSVRVLLSAGPTVAPAVVRDSIKAAVRDCDACFGGCTVTLPGSAPA